MKDFPLRAKRPGHSKNFLTKVFVHILSTELNRNGRMVHAVRHTISAGMHEYYNGVGLFADPIHTYITFTVPREREHGAWEIAEKDVIDTLWMQRLRYIYQLQSARWVFPGAEHSRFQHSLGTMHVAGRFAQQLYPSLREIAPTCPSLPYVEALLRISGLLHDIGHGPFGHFFDDNHLARYGLGHEALGQQIIVQELGEYIQGIRRSPSGPLASEERLEPHYVAYLMQKKELERSEMPAWLRYLKPVLSGMYTADNLDYVLRDAYMCGIAIGPVDLERLLHYSMITRPGLTLHKAGVGALTMFLHARLYMYTHVYFHRTIRAIDLHLREIFPATMAYLFPWNPLANLEQYQRLTDWALLETVRDWANDAVTEKRFLGEAWQRILGRKIKWKMAYDATLSIREHKRQATQELTPEYLVQRIRQELPPQHSALPFQLDIATQDPRNINPFIFGGGHVHIYDPATQQVHHELLNDILEHIPSTMVQYRLYTTEPASHQLLARACESAFGQRSWRTADFSDGSAVTGN